MIFLSNLVLPLETLSPLIQTIARYNPYVITSESIRKAMLFGASFDTLYIEMLMLLMEAVIALVLVVVAKKIFTYRYFSFGTKKKLILVPEDHFLIIHEKGIIIKDVQDLAEALRKLSDEDYLKLVKPTNVFSNWLRDNLKAKVLASRIRKKSREKTIKTLESYLNKS
jgi:hypothetical protein